MELLNLILPSIISIVAITVLYFAGKGLGLLAGSSQVMTIVSTIANNTQLRNIAKQLCEYAQKYVSPVALTKLKWVVEQVKNYCKQSGITITESQVLEIVQSTYDENKDAIKQNQFVQELEKVFANNDNQSLTNN